MFWSSKLIMYDNHVVDATFFSNDYMSFLWGNGSKHI